MPKDAALSDEPCPTNRTSFAPRLRASAATRAYSRSCRSSPRSACGCPRISARNCEPGSGGGTCRSGCNELIASDEDALDLETFGEDDDVGGEPGVEPARLRLADDARRDRRRRVHRLGEQHAER